MRAIHLSGLLFTGCLLVTGSGMAAAADLNPMEQLGKNLFFDNISDPDRMSCAACHAPEVGFTGSNPGINKHGSVYRGAVPTRFGNRKPPSAAYATLSPVFHYDAAEELFVGGNFWDGRATGEILGNPAADQAGGPFLNPVEHNMADKKAVCEQVAPKDYASLFPVVFGEAIQCDTEQNVEMNYDRIALAIAAYEGSSEVNQFSSKFDAYLAGDAQLSDIEMQGLALFTGKAQCSACHPVEPGPNGEPPPLTDFTFDNLGAPRNPDNPSYKMDKVYLDDGSPINPEGINWVDPGLGGFIATVPAYAAMAGDNLGKHKVPTLRNVDKRYGKSFPKAFGHNGYFKSLKAIVHFYNTSSTKDTCPDPFTTEQNALKMDCWPEAEVAVNINTEELGDLGLTDAEEDAVVAFLATLSDGYEKKKTKNKVPVANTLPLMIQAKR